MEETADSMGALVVDQVFMALLWGKARVEHVPPARERVVLEELVAQPEMVVSYFQRQ
ncbi:MAG: hypothetical protein VB096_04915 [Pseudoflavonifractor sp.]|nr:hypothetical protein [Pseudoflavonifractor sp.]